MGLTAAELQVEEAKNRLRAENVKVNAMLEDHEKNKKTYQAILLLIFIAGISGGSYIFLNMPNLTAQEISDMKKFPPSIAELQVMTEIFKSYAQKNPTYVLVAWSYAYLFLQVFAIPGGIFLSLMAGPLFGFKMGFVYVAIIASTGSSCCYLLSQTLLKGFIINWQPEKVYQLCTKVQAQKGNLFLLMIF